MNTATDKPCLVSWLTIPLLVVLGTIGKYHYLTIQMQRISYVVSNYQLVFISCMDLLIIGIGYWLIKRKGWKFNALLLFVHHYITVFVLFVFILFRQLLGDTTVYADSTLSLLFIFSVGQLIFLLNIFYALHSYYVSQKSDQHILVHSGESSLNHMKSV